MEPIHATWPDDDAAAEWLVARQADGTIDVRGPFLKDARQSVPFNFDEGREIFYVGLTEEQLAMLGAPADDEDLSKMTIVGGAEPCVDGRLSVDNDIVVGPPIGTTFLRLDLSKDPATFDAPPADVVLAEFASFRFPRQTTCARTESLVPFALPGSFAEINDTRIEKILPLDDNTIVIGSLAHMFVAIRSAATSSAGHLLASDFGQNMRFGTPRRDEAYSGPGYRIAVPLRWMEAGYVLDTRVVNGNFEVIRQIDTGPTYDLAFEGDGTIVAASDEQLMTIAADGTVTPSAIDPGHDYRTIVRADGIYLVGTRKGSILEGLDVNALSANALTQSFTFDTYQIVDIKTWKDSVQLRALIATQGAGLFYRHMLDLYLEEPLMGGPELANCGANRNECGFYPAPKELGTIALFDDAQTMIIPTAECTWPLVHDFRTDCTTLIERPDVALQTDAEEGVRAAAHANGRTYVATRRELYELR